MMSSANAELITATEELLDTFDDAVDAMWNEGFSISQAIAAKARFVRVFEQRFGVTLKNREPLDRWTS